MCNCLVRFCLSEFSKLNLIQLTDAKILSSSLKQFLFQEKRDDVVNNNNKLMKLNTLLLSFSNFNFNFLLIQQLRVRSSERKQLSGR